MTKLVGTEDLVAPEEEGQEYITDFGGGSFIEQYARITQLDNFIRPPSLLPPSREDVGEGGLELNEARDEWRQEKERWIERFGPDAWTVYTSAVNEAGVTSSPSTFHRIVESVVKGGIAALAGWGIASAIGAAGAAGSGTAAGTAAATEGAALTPYVSAGAGAGVNTMTGAAVPAIDVGGVAAGSALTGAAAGAAGSAAGDAAGNVVSDVAGGGGGGVAGDIASGLAGNIPAWLEPLLGGLLPILGADAASGAAEAASEAQLTGVREGIDFLRESRDLSLEQTEPWRRAGITALGGMMDMSGLGRPDVPIGGGAEGTMSDLPGYDWKMDPGYEFRLKEGTKAIEAGAAARGGLLSGGTGKALLRYGQDYASNEYSKVYNRLSNIAGYGQTNPGAALTYGTGAAELATVGGAARGSGYAAQGNIWFNAAEQIGRNIGNWMG